MDWFEQLTGFREDTGPQGYARNRERLEVDGQQLRSTTHGRSYGIGRLEVVSLKVLREQALAGAPVSGRPGLRIVRGDVGALHTLPEFEGALFQVASQFNLLEMVSPDVTPEDGVTRYAHDRTQGPACAVAAGAATLFRNYGAPVGGQMSRPDQTGQTHDRQIDCFAALGPALADAVRRPARSLWTMRNGYAIFEREGVDTLSAHLTGLDAQSLNDLRDQLQIGMHWDVEVTRGVPLPGPRVSQAFCSALPVGYCHCSGAHWAPLATLVLEAAYEATLWAAVLNAQCTGQRTVLLTLLGGGVFGNDEAWILAALRRALKAVRGQGLDIVMVSFNPPSAALERCVFEQNPA